MKKFSIPRALLALLMPFALACGDEGGEAPSPTSAAAQTSARTGDGHEGHAHNGEVAGRTPNPNAPPRPERRGIPLPAFDGVSLDGAPLSLSSFIGQRFVLFGVNPELPGAQTLATALAEIAPARAAHNFALVGVSAGGEPSATRALLKTHGLAGVPTFNDERAEIGRAISLRAPLWVLLVDADGNMLAASGVSTDGDDAGAELTRTLREMLRLDGGAPDPLELLGGAKPPAPELSALNMRDGSRFELSENLQRGVALIFFLHTCPHCHRALDVMQKVLAQIPEAERPLLAAVSVVDRPNAVLPMLRDEGLEDFLVLRDPDGSLQRAYNAERAVPATFLIDAQGRITARVDGWRELRDPPLMRMRLLKLAAQPVPILLHKTGYSGNEFCGVCHESETLTWELTRHAGAYNTLVKHGADHDAECVQCHVVGYGQESGFEIARPQRGLEDVGCETCHGRGGPHLSPGLVREHNYEAVCVTCHNPQHSLGFEYASFLPKVSHAATLAIAKLPKAEREARLAELRVPRSGLPTDAEYVGSPACRTCHAQEFERWNEHAHARAFQTLEAKGESANADCLRCHTTGFGAAGGFPKQGAGEAHAALKGVGCESCHGPGGNHVPEDAPKRGSILSLADKCDSCVILKICGSCHDDANDPGFEFKVIEKIELQRHSDKEIKTGDAGDVHFEKPAALPASTVNALLATALGGDGGGDRAHGDGGDGGAREMFGVGAR